jgi:hypothetical protein
MGETKRFAKSLFWAAAIMAGAFFGYPILKEGADSPCDALALRAISMASQGSTPPPGGSALANAFGGAIVRAAVAARYPGLPPVVACGGLYWRSLADRSTFRDIAYR